ncbi:DUF87 domain-containing protein [Fructobacillus sp. M1-13]|uniref:DUF87 domain-containing protein n=1 Tax=Fructobacillus papyriferae TaxID=2713171 RepID=A0ABS5QQZ7_9LACO|nr:DUF87 domain-containing protein [Fructobacillus papyriferae]MBS9335347.1 DUF87 domain-containing protein [Fructobacillus papyriferae]MCD2158984.1 DUF87 domain-containing protein [Fructobacillus papyriferae]
MTREKEDDMREKSRQLNLGKRSMGRAMIVSDQELLGKHLLIIGQTGAGKSTTSKKILTALQKQNQTNIVFDPTGEYQSDLPNGIRYTVGKNAFLDVTSLSAEELLVLLDLDWDELLKDKLGAAIQSLKIQSQKPWTRGQLLHKVNRTVQEQRAAEEALPKRPIAYPIDQLADQLVLEFVLPYKDERSDYLLLGQEPDHEALRHYWPSILALRAKLEDDSLNRVFQLQARNADSVTQYELGFVMKTFMRSPNEHRSLVLDLSLLQAYPVIQRRVLSALFDTALKIQLATDQKRPVTLCLDEAHRYLPDNERLSDNGLFHVLREGRKSQLRLLMTTQALADLPLGMQGQFGSVLLHRNQEGSVFTALSLKKKWQRRLPNFAVGQVLLLTPTRQTAFLVTK